MVLSYGGDFVSGMVSAPDGMMTGVIPAESRSKVSQSLEGCLITLSLPIYFQILDIP